MYAVQRAPIDPTTEAKEMTMLFPHINHPDCTNDSGTALPPSCGIVNSVSNQPYTISQPIKPAIPALIDHSPRRPIFPSPFVDSEVRKTHRQGGGGPPISPRPNTARVAGVPMFLCARNACMSRDDRLP